MRLARTGAYGDYSVPLSVTFAVGERTKTIEVVATDDGDDDDGESVSLSFVNAANDRLITANGSARTTVALQDNDGAGKVEVSFAAATYTATEGGSGATVRVELDKAPGRSVTVPLAVTHLGGALPADYSGIPSTVTFGANQTEMSFTVNATNDSGADGGESLRIGFGALPEGVVAAPPAAAVVTLADSSEPTFVVNRVDRLHGASPSGRWVPTAETPSRTPLRRPDRGRARALRGARRVGGQPPGTVVSTNTAWAAVAVPKGRGQSRSMANERWSEIADRVPGFGCACRGCRTSRRMGSRGCIGARCRPCRRVPWAPLRGDQPEAGEPQAGADVARRAASACDDAGHSVKSPQYWGCPEALGRFILEACVSAAGSWAPAASRCRVAAGHQRTNGGFLATEPMAIGSAERAQARAP